MLRNFSYIKGLSVFTVLILWSCFVPFQGVFAAFTVFESHIGVSPATSEVLGHLPGEQFGASISSGDFNGDGFDDLVVGAPFSSTALNDWNGSVSVFFGGPTMRPGSVLLSESSPDISFYGEFSGDMLGSSLSTGDFNGDGFDDIAIGAYNAYSNGERPGKVYIFSGQVDMSSQAHNLSINKPNIEYIGRLDGDSFGLTLSTVDINVDGIDDLIVGAPKASPQETPNTGAAYAFYGVDNHVDKRIHMLANELPDILFFGHVSNGRFGSSIATGHVLGRGYPDVVIGSYMVDNVDKIQTGAVYFFKGRANWQSFITNPTSTIFGTKEREWFGFDIDINSLSGDKYEDIAITSFPFSDRSVGGRVSIFNGGEQYAIEGGIFNAEDEFISVLIDDSKGEALIGSDVLLDDFNTDGYVDIFVGAPGVSTASSLDSGDVYMLYGGENSLMPYYSVYENNLTGVLHGENADDWFGYKIISMDYNGDGFKDLVVGSRYSDTEYASDVGKVFIVFGSDLPFGDLVEKPSFTENVITRGELVSKVVNEFNISDKKQDFINNCYQHKEFCLFNFMAMSLYDDVRLEPELILYPDILPGSRYYDDVITATILGIINGYTNEEGSPFHPEKPITRIQALKIVLGATDLVEPMYKFELELEGQKSYFEDIDPQVASMWWYPRYANFSLEANIISDEAHFRPDDNITFGELEDIISRTIEYLNSLDKNEEA